MYSYLVRAIVGYKSNELTDDVQIGKMRRNIRGSTPSESHVC